MRTIIKTCTVAAMVLVFFGCEPEEDAVPMVDNQSFTESELMALVDQSDLSDPNGRHGKPTKTYSPVLDLVNGAVNVGNSLLIRTHNGVSMALKANMEPGHTATVWWVIFNNPENCAYSPCGGPGFEDFFDGENTGLAMLFAGGTVVSNSGIATFAGHLKEGVINEGANFPIFGQPERPLVDSETADLRYVVRSHGPKITGQVHEQTSTWGGGCVVDFAPFSAIPQNEGECGDIYVSLH